MILANEQVAQLLERKRVPAVYRVHAQPDPGRVERLVEQLHALGVPTPPLGQGLAPSQAAEVAAEASRLVIEEAARRGHGREAYTSLVLRSLMQASYSDRNSGHAGLGSPAYCHFTSPIRRYPDLLVHRALLATLGEGEAAPRAAEAREVAWHCSERERESARIERDADDVCAAYLLERELARARRRGGVRGRGLRGDPGRRLRRLRRRAGRRLRGLRPGPHDGGGALRAERDRDGAGGARVGHGAAARRSDIRPRERRGSARGRADLELAGG